ncbi:MAG: hypothetical protein ACI4RM_04885, partial [Ruminococcus sp.]
MKRLKISKYINLLIIAVFTIFSVVSFADFPVYADGNTEVIARIDTVPTVSTEPNTEDSNNTDVEKGGEVETGDLFLTFFVVSIGIMFIS